MFCWLPKYLSGGKKVKSSDMMTVHHSFTEKCCALEVTILKCASVISRDSKKLHVV